MTSKGSLMVCAGRPSYVWVSRAEEAARGISRPHYEHNDVD